MSEYKDDLEDLEYALAWARSGWHCHENPETGEERPLTDHEYSDRLLEILLKGGFPDRYVERRITEHINRPTPSGWTITREDMIVLSDQEQDQLLQIVSKVRRARRESSNMIEHHPVEVIEIEVIEVEDAEPALHPWEES